MFSDYIITKLLALKTQYELRRALRNESLQAAAKDYLGLRPGATFEEVEAALKRRRERSACKRDKL